nr:PREDICTED: uncharacterized protein LOC109041899 [Bemisia tabaci]
MQHARLPVIFMTICLIQLFIRPTRPASLIPGEPDYVGSDDEVYCQTHDGYLKKPHFPIVWISSPIKRKMKPNGDYTCRLNEDAVKRFLDRHGVSFAEFKKKYNIGHLSLKYWMAHVQETDIKLGYPPYNLDQLREEKRKAEAKTYDENGCKKHCEDKEGWIVEYRNGTKKDKGKDQGNHQNDIKPHGKGTDHGNHQNDIKPHGKGTDRGNQHNDNKTHDKGTDHGNQHTDFNPPRKLRRIHITHARVTRDKKCHCELNHIEVREFLVKQGKERLSYNFARLWGINHSQARQYLRDNGIDIEYADTPRKSLANWFKEPL